MACENANNALELSKLVYKNSDGTPTQGGSVPVGYNKIEVNGRDYFEDKGTGYYGEAYSNGTTVIIASRGTDNWSPSGGDFQTNAEMVARKTPEQLQSLENFYHDLNISGQQVIFSGHSMGGSLSQLMAAQTSGSQAITFDAYGTKAILEAKQQSTAGLENRIVNFIAKDDITGNAADQPGKCYFVPGSGDITGGLLNTLGDLTVLLQSSGGMTLANQIDQMMFKSHSLNNFNGLDLANPEQDPRISTIREEEGRVIIKSCGLNK